MRILHVVTLVRPDSAYGGPVRVAENQCTALLSRGHDVRFAPTPGYAATEFRSRRRGWDSRPTVSGTYDDPAGVRMRGVTRRPASVRWARRHAGEFDVAHVHLARDFVTLPAALALLPALTPVVVQPHGMIDASDRLLAKPLDHFLTKPVLRAASSVFHLTPRESDDLAGVAGGIHRPSRTA